TFAPLTQLTPEMNTTGIESKQKGQINLVLLGLDHVTDGGSFTLITGVMMDDPIRQGASAAMANGAVKHFVKAAAIDRKSTRLNSSHVSISYAVFCLKKKKKKNNNKQ